MKKYWNSRKLKLTDIIKTFEEISALSRQQIDCGHYEAALQMIETGAKIAYHFNWIYSDEELEAQLKTISGQLLKSESINHKSGRIVFFDSWGWDSRGLTQQYIRAMIALEIEFLYVFENEDPEQSREIRSELEAYEKCEIFSINRSLPLADRLGALYKQILVYSPEKLLMHITPWAVEALIVFHALPTVCKYQINLTDHTFWLGTGCLDYSLEFRDYGCTVSLEKRKLSRDQLLMNPYYPINSGEVFRGFPDEVEKRVVIFSGSSFYKVYGRNGAYFQLVKRLLSENPECVLLFAGGGDDREIRKFISENHLEERFILLGSRSDINEVFSNCDIYLGTYPICGGLMSQLAAVNSKPILAYTTPDIPCNYVEGIVCHKQQTLITYTDKDAFFAEARKLVLNEEYRHHRGAVLREAIISPKDFNNNFENLLGKKQGPISFDHEIIDYDRFTALYLEVENDYLDSFKRLLLKTFHIKLPLLFPKVFLKITLALILRSLAYPTKNGN